MKRLPVRISDHAVLRYLERVGGFEIEALRAALAARVAKTAVPGVSNILIDGHRFLIKQTEDELVVATILPAGLRSLNDPGEKR